MSDVPAGILVMAYGTPASLDEVEEYYTDIRHGRPPPPELLEELIKRYKAIGGTSPLLEITETQAAGVSERVGLPCYLGMKHAPPFISEAVGKMASDHIGRAVGLVLAPHYSAMSVGDYERRIRRAAEELGWTAELTMIANWHLEPGYIDVLVRFVHDALHSLPPEARDDSVVLFTAHSLPEKILQASDPYPTQLRETAEAVADVAQLGRWEVAWQSAGRSDVAWLGPDVLELMERMAKDGASGVVVCPCGFVADHLEVLYDVDIECKERAVELGIAFARTASPNAHPDFLDTLAAVVERTLER
jgi:protoporphyrin/coproporphyrin ferrochelatase